VNPNIIRTLMERDWIKIAGYRDVPGKPALFATTKTFLDHFNLKKISELPPLSELVDFEALEKQLGLQSSNDNINEDTDTSDKNTLDLDTNDKNTLDLDTSDKNTLDLDTSGSECINEDLTRV